jgi:hypothetical protein
MTGEQTVGYLARLRGMQHDPPSVSSPSASTST